MEAYPLYATLKELLLADSNKTFNPSQVNSHRSATLWY